MRIDCPCGEHLAELEDDGRVTVGDLSVTFRRTTDFVVCPSCLRGFRAQDLRTGLVRERALWELKLLNEVAAAR